MAVISVVPVYVFTSGYERNLGKIEEYLVIFGIVGSSFLFDFDPGKSPALL